MEKVKAIAIIENRGERPNLGIGMVNWYSGEIVLALLDTEPSLYGQARSLTPAQAREMAAALLKAASDVEDRE